ncbi:MAG: phage shock protein C, partial [Glaciecola sp.]
MKRGELYRIKREGKIGGVCAGIADYFGIETWLVRILTVTAFLLLAGPFILVAYVALWFILDEKSAVKSSENTYDHKGFVNSKQASASGEAGYTGKGFKNNSQDNHHKVEVKSKVWQAGVPPRQAFLDIKQRYMTVEDKLRKLESY